MTEQEAMDFLIKSFETKKVQISVYQGAKRISDRSLPEGAEAYDQSRPIDAIVCRPCDDQHPLLLLDNKIGQCHLCHRRVQFRPHTPPGEKTCLFCAVDLIKKGEGP